MSDRILTGLYVLAYEGTDELRAVPGSEISTMRMTQEMLAEHENALNVQAATKGEPVQRRIVVVEVMLPCRRVVRG